MAQNIGNMTFRAAAAAGLCTVVLWGTACQKNPNPVAPASNPTPSPKKPLSAAKKGPGAEELTAGMVQAAPQGKSPLALDMKFELASRPKVGQSLEVNVALISQVSGGPAAVQVTAVSGFVPPEAGAFEIPEVQMGEVYRHSFKVTPSGEGLQVLNVSVSLKHDDVNDTKLFSIPVIVDVK